MSTLSWFLRFVGGLLLAISLAGPSITPGSAQEEDQLAVVATNSIVEDLVANVGGDKVAITTIVDVGVDPHSFEPVPEQVVELSKAAMIFEIGVEYETWLDEIYESSGSDATRVVLSDGIDLRTNEDGHHDEEGDHEEEGSHDDMGSPEAAGHDDEDSHGDMGSPEAASHEEEGSHEEGDGHDHGEFDPHIWQSVANAEIMVEHIRDALITADPDNSATYEENAAGYLVELQALDAEIFEGIGSIPEDQRLLVTSHDTFGYYADRYGLDIVGTALPSFSTEGVDPAASDITELITAIEASGAPAIFPESTQDPGIMEQIAADAGVNLGPPLYTDSLGAPGSPGETYVGMMRFNTEAIVQGLTA